MSLFLLGPRQTGKSTLIQESMPNALVIDLLSRATFQQLASNPDSLLKIVGSSNAEVIVVEQVQKLPSLLDVVQKSIFENQGRKNFLLTGSSARKLNRQGVNLLGGRAAQVTLHPLLLSEMEDSQFHKFVQWGTLPSVVTQSSEDMKRRQLESYVSLYLDQEIRAEGLSRNIEHFSRFLEIAALQVSRSIFRSLPLMFKSLKKLWLNGLSCWKTHWWDACCHAFKKR